MKLGLKVSRSKDGRGQIRGAYDDKWYNRLHHSRLVKFLPFLLIAFFIWIQQSLQSKITRPLYIPIGSDSISVSLGLQGKIPEYIVVQVRDKGWEHIRYELTQFDTIQVRLIHEKDGHNYVGLTHRELNDAIVSQLSTGATIVQTSISEIKIPAFKRGSKRLPIELGGKPQTANGLTIGEIRFVPDSITVYGDAHLLASLKSIQITSWQDSLISKDISREVPLRLAHGLYSDIRRVQLSIKLEELTQQSFVLPIEVLNAPANYQVRVLPSTVTLLVTFPRKYFNELTEDKLRVTADYAKRNSDTGEIEVRLSTSPSWIVSAHTSSDIVQYIIEQE